MLFLVFTSNKVMPVSFSAEPETWAQHADGSTTASKSSCILKDVHIHNFFARLIASWRQEAVIGSKRPLKIGKERRHRAYRSSAPSAALVQHVVGLWHGGLQCNMAAALPTAFSSPYVSPGWEHLALCYIWKHADVTFGGSQTSCHQNAAWSNLANVQFCLESLWGLSTVRKKKKSKSVSSLPQGSPCLHILKELLS